MDLNYKARTVNSFIDILFSHNEASANHRHLHVNNTDIYLASCTTIYTLISIKNCHTFTVMVLLPFWQLLPLE